MLRRTKAQVLDDLPPRTELIAAASKPDAAEARPLRSAAPPGPEPRPSAGAGAAAPGGRPSCNILAELTRLRRAACDPRLVTPEARTASAPRCRPSRELAAELVANGHKALVFSQFVDFLTLLREPLDAAGIAYQYLDGSTPRPSARAASPPSRPARATCS